MDTLDVKPADQPRPMAHADFQLGQSFASSDRFSPGSQATAEELEGYQPMSLIGACRSHKLLEIHYVSLKM